MQKPIEINAKIALTPIANQRSALNGCNISPSMTVPNKNGTMKNISMGEAWRPLALRSISSVVHHGPDNAQIKIFAPIGKTASAPLRTSELATPALFCGGRHPSKAAKGEHEIGA
jgi:hypothetical protein